MGGKKRGDLFKVHQATLSQHEIHQLGFLVLYLGKGFWLNAEPVRFLSKSTPVERVTALVSLAHLSDSICLS